MPYSFLRVWMHSLAPLKQQVMVYPDITTSHLIGVEMPAISLPFLNCFTDILVVLNFHAHVFFQPNSPPVAPYQNYDLLYS